MNRFINTLLLSLSVGLSWNTYAAEPFPFDRVMELSPSEANPRNSEGDFIQLNDGRILFIYTHFTSGASDWAQGFLASRVSSNGGKTWSKQDKVEIKNEGGMNTMSVSLLRLQTGEIALFYLRKNDKDDCRPYIRISTDEANTWSEPTLIIPRLGYYVGNNDRVVQLRSGRLVFPIAVHSLDGAEFTGVARAAAWISDDNGKTWRRSKTILTLNESTRTGLQEPGMVELSKDNHLLLFARTDQKVQYFSQSTDGGDTWSPVYPSTLKSPVSPAVIETLPGTNTLVCVWNNHEGIDPKLAGFRTPLSIGISKNDGATWTTLGHFELDPDGWYCYTAMDVVGDHMLLGYCNGNSRIGRLNRTTITRIALKDLAPKP